MMAKFARAKLLPFFLEKSQMGLDVALERLRFAK